jgi:amino acid adenylation domain-containing protein
MGAYFLQRGATLVDVFESVVDQFPKNVAIEFGGQFLTYRELSTVADVLAQELVAKHSVGPGDRVALCLEPSIGTVAWIIAILRCGAAYVPLDVLGPPTRNKLVLDDCAPRVVVGGPDGIDPSLPAADSTAPQRTGGVAARPTDMDCCYVIYTSGTTGIPKGVPVTHANVLALFRATAELFDFRPDDVWTLCHSVAFDFSVWEIWGSLLHGARLVVVEQWTKMAPDAFFALVRDKGVTVLNQTPTAFSLTTRAAIEFSAEPDRTALRYVIFGGERLLPSRLRPWVQHFGWDRPELVNMYGLTEATVHATHHRLSAADLDCDDSVIGMPLPGFTHRLDGDEPASGELLVGGPQVVEGYLHRPKLTAERFVDIDGQRFYRTGDLVDSRSGTLVYLGRRDRQLKVRGHRIELGEVAAAVAAAAGVADVCVVVLGPVEAQVIGCAYTTTPGEEVSPRTLRSQLLERLPRYMLPERFMIFEGLPMTVNGKVDVDAVQRDLETRIEHRRIECRAEVAEFADPAGAGRRDHLAAPTAGG